MNLPRRHSGSGRVVVFGVVLVCALCTGAFGQPWDGSGTEGDPYQIWTAEDMQAIGADANYWDAHFLLCADINLAAYTGTSFNIIGDYDNPFIGAFDGNDHTILNFNYSTNGMDNIGLFGYVGSFDSKIKNVGLIYPDVNARTGCFCVGALVGYCYDTSITNCYVDDGSVTGELGVGGLAGNVRGWAQITNCHSSASIYGVVDVGGLVGGTGEHSAWSSPRIFDCYSTGNIWGEETNAGGLIGSSRGEVGRCWASGNVRGDDYVGGLVGKNLHELYESYAEGIVEGETYVGGLAGESAWELYESYAVGAVLGAYEVGGLVGTGGGFFSNCYSIGSVSGNGFIGGLMGYSNGGSYTKCFWDSDVNPDVNGIGNGSDPNVIGETSVEMQTESTFTDAGWDFVGEVINGANDIWDICEGTNYPKFVWQIPAGDLACPDGVTLVDFSVLGAAWYSGPGDGNWDPNCDISEPNDNLIDERDLRVFAGSYLEGIR